MNHFLIVYDRTSGDSLSLKEFDSGSGDIDLQERFVLERVHKDEPNIEVIVLGSSSLESLKRTHSRYFEQLSLESFDRSKLEEIRRLATEVAEPKAS